MTADQPAEATQPRLWLGTVTGALTYRHDVLLWGPIGGMGNYRDIADDSASVRPDRVTDQRPAVVVPQREDEGEVERLTRVALDADDAVIEALPWWLQVEGMVRAVLAAQRPAAPVGDEVREAIDNLAHITECHCGPAWTERGLHGPECRSDYRDDLVVLADAVMGQRAAPVAVDEATVARVLEEHGPSTFRQRISRSGIVVECACGWSESAPDDYDLRAARFRAHQAAEVVRALATQDEKAERRG